MDLGNVEKRKPAHRDYEATLQSAREPSCPGHPSASTGKRMATSGSGTIDLSISVNSHIGNMDDRRRVDRLIKQRQEGDNPGLALLKSPTVSVFSASASDDDT